jgi:Txe/YoeB family toxin of Txe-Axe toxin-antitoxin module
VEKLNPAGRLIATFSIVGLDKKTGDIGVAVASKFLAVGSIVPWADPNGGAIADWGGGKYHVEFTVDHDKKQATVYILDNDAKSPAPVKASELVLSVNDPVFEVELKPEPLEGETGGVSSRFVGQHDNLGTVREFAGTISGEVDGTPYAGDFKEEPHAE